MDAYDTLLSALELDPRQGLTIISANELAAAYFPPLNPDLGALIIDLSSSHTTNRALRVLRSLYPHDHRIALVRDKADPVLELSLDELEADQKALAFYLPPMEPHFSFESLQNTVAHLRAPEGCPWDREQTHASLRKHLLEEAYEVLEALDQANLDGLQEELGDLLLQILMHAQIAQEQGNFRMSDVVFGIQTKLIRRHPHVFGDVEVSSVDQVLNNWEHYKSEERVGGPLEGVPRALPALAQSAELQDRASRVGFDWDQQQDKMEGDFFWLTGKGEQQLQPEQLGDMLFAIVNYARQNRVDPEAELQQTNQQFRAQFSNLLEAVFESGQQLEDLERTDLIQLWNDSKQRRV